MSALSFWQWIILLVVLSVIVIPGIISGTDGKNKYGTAVEKRKGLLAKLARVFKLTLKGRVSRSDYWLFLAIDFCISLVLLIPEGVYFPLYAFIVDCVFFVFYVCVVVRRLHDCNLKGHWALVLLVFPMLGVLEQLADETSFLNFAIWYISNEGTRFRVVGRLIFGFALYAFIAWLYSRWKHYNNKAKK